MKQISLHLGQLSGRVPALARIRQVGCVRPAAASWRPADHAAYAATGFVVLTRSGNATNATNPAGTAGFMGTDPVATKRPARHLATRST